MLGSPQEHPRRRYLAASGVFLSILMTGCVEDFPPLWSAPDKPAVSAPGVDGQVQVSGSIRNDVELRLRNLTTKVQVQRPIGGVQPGSQPYEISIGAQSGDWLDLWYEKIDHRGVTVPSEHTSVKVPQGQAGGLGGAAGASSEIVWGGAAGASAETGTP